MIETSQQQGVSARRSCSLLAIAHRRVVRWQQQARQGQPLANLSPGPQAPLHRVLPEEIDQIVTLAQSQEYVDLSHRILAVTAWDKGLLEGGLTDQNILDLTEDQRPEIINDRGRQMKAKPIQRLCEDHGMPQLFARPRTPNDNPFIESAFSTVKRAPEYPGRFLDDDQAVAYFKRYFTWYDTEHYHSGSDYVTPQQAHDGQRQIIVEQRRAKKLAQRRRRRAENQKPKPAHEKQTNITLTMPASLVA